MSVYNCNFFLFITFPTKQVLLGEIQHDADELLQLVLSYPEFAEPLKLIQHFQEQQNAWMEEKRALLVLVKSWENLVLKINGEDKRDVDKGETINVCILSSFSIIMFLNILNTDFDF